MKNFGIIFFMSYLLSLMPIAFGAQNGVVEVGQLTLIPDSGYYYHTAQDRQATPLTTISQERHDGFSSILDDIRKKTVSESEKMQPISDAFSLPIFAVTIPNQTTDKTIRILDPSGTETTCSSSALHRIFSGLNGTDAVALVYDNKKIAFLTSLKSSYNPGQMANATPESLHATDIIFSWQQQPQENLHTLLNINTTADNMIILELKKETQEIAVSISLEQLEQLSKETYTEESGINNFVTITKGQSEVILQLNKEMRNTFKKTHADLVAAKNRTPEISKPTSRTFTQNFGYFATGIIAAFFGVYAISKLEYWNKDLAPAMEAKLSLLFTRLLDSWQNKALDA